MNAKRKGLVTVVAVVAAGALVVGVAVAAIPNGSSIDACYDVKTGVLRVVDLETGIPARCSAKEKALSWNQVGPQGEPGASGEQGLQGVPGEQGPPGTFSGTFTSPNGRFSISVTDDGLQFAGTGGSIEISNTGITVDSSGELTVRSDDALTVDADGDVTITGAGTVELEGSVGVNIKSSGDVTVKGSKIGQN